MMIDGVNHPDEGRTVEESEAVRAIIDALVDQGYMDLRDSNNERYALRILRNLERAGFVIRRR